VPLNPLGRWPRDGTVDVYYELYGLPRATPVATRLTVERAGGRSFFQRLFGGGRGVNLEYATVTDSAGRARVRQRIVLSGLSPGRYDLTLTLRDPTTHHLVVRRQSFDVT
jgi:hypothetical protein